MLLKDRARTASAGTSTRRRILGLLGLIAACWGALFATLPASSGDPTLVSTSPGDTEVVASPDEVRLTFDQPVSAELATVRMTKPNGDQVVHSRPRNPPGAADTIAVPMPDTRYAGTYSVAWSVPSSRLQSITGTFSFHVFSPSEPVHVPEIANERTPIVATAHTVARLAAIAAFTLGAGLFLVLAVAWPAGSRHAPARRLITCAWWVLVGGTLGTILTFGAYAAQTSLAETFDPALVSGTLGSRIGAALLARLLVLVPITIALVRLSTSRTAVPTMARWSTPASGLACAAALAATWSFARPRDPNGPALLTLGAETALLLTLAASVGGAVLLWTLLRGAGNPALRTVAPRLARLLLACAALLVALAVTTTSGWQMVALVLLGVLTGGTGLVARRWVHCLDNTSKQDPPAPARLRRLAEAAICAAIATLVIGAVTTPDQSQLALEAEPVSTTQ